MKERALQGIDQMVEIKIGGVDPMDMTGHWLASSEPSISVENVDGHIVLRSATLTVEQIEDAWLCASTNERLLVANGAARRLVLEELLG